MILLRSDFLVFELSNGDKIPCSASTVTVELMGSAIETVDRDTVEHGLDGSPHQFHRHRRGGARDQVAVAHLKHQAVGS